MTELRQDVPKAGNKPHRPKEIQKKEERIIKELGTKMNLKKATSKNLRIVKGQ